MERFIIGIDTGGTYTDAVLLDVASHQVLATAKVPTTHFDLAQGAGRVLSELLTKSGVAANRVSQVCISSTLATNSVVENKGARVAVMVIGHVRHFKLPVTAVLFIKGGHTIDGKEEEPLELDYMVSLVEGLKNEVDAYGVCAAMSMHNPTHELVAEKAIAMLDPKPVFCSHRISKLTGMHERAATAGLHAKLMPVMQRFIDGVSQAMASLGLDCPAVVIGGNGQPLEVQRAVSEAGLTVASGPACTAHFGAAHTGGDALVIDVGGTTTDIAIVEKGRVLLAGEGCTIGEWKTHVEAVDMHTAGIGGDSHVHIDEHGKLSIGPGRVTPIAMSAESEESIALWLGVDDRSRLIVVRPEAVEHLPSGGVSALLREQGRLTPAVIRQRTGLGGVPLNVELERLTRHNLINECGFTPTDALHVLGHLDLGKREVAQRGAALLGAALGVSGEEFSALVIERTETLIENLIIDYVIQRTWQNSLAAFISGSKNHPVLGVEFSIKVPLIGVGAAARTLLPQVAERLRTTISFPENCEVGNAFGAALIGLRRP
jgi:N-methylhydantoinase A/oxoprolinase/acetone carboxylase beta subunit